MSLINDLRKMDTMELEDKKVFDPPWMLVVKRLGSFTMSNESYQMWYHEAERCGTFLLTWLKENKLYIDTLTNGKIKICKK